MQVTSRFTLAIHSMIFIAYFSDKCKVTSDFIAMSTNSNPVIIRRILGQLKEANLVQVRAGVGGATIPRPLSEITLLDIFNAVEVLGGTFFNFHPNPNHHCPVGQNIHSVLDDHLADIQCAMNQKMEAITLDTLFAQADALIPPPTPEG